MNTSQFTLAIKLAGHQTDQRGPARIVSLSGGTDRRNFTLAQGGNSLVFRLRIPLTGENGAHELVAPGVFWTTEIQTLIITYDGEYLSAYSNRGFDHSLFGEVRALNYRGGESLW
jgi:hypothetical protein